MDICEYTACGGPALRFHYGMGALGLHVASCATSILNVIYNGVLMRSGTSQFVCVKVGLTSCRYCLNALRVQCVPVKDIPALIACSASQSHPACDTGVRHVEGERSRPSGVKRRSPPRGVQGVACRAGMQGICSGKLCGILDCFTLFQARVSCTSSGRIHICA